MIKRPARYRYPAASVLLLLVSLTPAQAFTLSEGAILLWEEATAAALLEGHTRVVVSDLAGTVSLRATKEGEMRYGARTLDNRRDELAVALWSDGRTLYLRGAEASAGQPVLLEIALGPGVDVLLDLTQSSIRVSGVRGDVAVRGTTLDIDVRDIVDGSIDIDVEDAEVVVIGAGAVSLRGADLRGRVTEIADELSLDVQRAGLSLRSIGELDADVEESTIEMAVLNGETRVRASRSAITVSDARRGARLWLSESTGRVSLSRGRFEVETDNVFEFSGMQDPLTIIADGYDSAIRGQESSGPVTIEQHGGEIALTKLEGAVQIEGADLQVALEALSGPLTMVTDGSNISVTQSDGEVKIHNDVGDVVLDRSTKPTEIVSTGGTVRATGVTGPLQIWADGEFVEVGWTTIASGTTGFIENESGGVHATFPKSARCRIEAETSYGRVESNLPGLETSGDESSVSGALNRGSAPMITIKAAGDVSLGYSGG